MIANTLSTDTPLTQGVGSKGQTISFTESSHVAYQIKGNWAQSTMKASMLSIHTQTTPGVRSKGHFCSFLKVVMLHIKVKWKKCRPTCKVTLWIYTQSWPLRLCLKVRYWNCADVSIFLSPDPKRIGGYSDQPGVRPSVRLSVCPSVRPSVRP